MNLSVNRRYQYTWFLTGFEPSINRVSEDVISAFQALLLVTGAPPVYPRYKHFTDVVNHYLDKPPFNYTDTSDHRPNMKVSIGHV